MLLVSRRKEGEKKKDCMFQSKPGKSYQPSDGFLNKISKYKSQVTGTNFLFHVKTLGLSMLCILDCAICSAVG